MRTDPPPSDQETRDRFRLELDKNFSVIAPAGVGKTRSIVDRVLEIAKSPHAREWLPKLVVVTYTNRAADEMQQRARNRILEAARDSLDGNKIRPEILGSFNRAFFGTIHSFCSKLLRVHGHHLGVPSKPELIEDDLDLWHEFTGKLEKVGFPLSSRQSRHCFRHRAMTDVIRLARGMQIQNRLRQLPPTESWDKEDPSIPDLQQIFSFIPDKRNEKSVQKGKEMLQSWNQKAEEGEDFLPFPVFMKGGREFVSLWRKTFEPMRRRLDQYSLAVACEISEKYRQYRLDQGFLTYNDQVDLAARLLEHPEAGNRLRLEELRIILDEAQDTDEKQFQVLTELARPPSAKGDWLFQGGEAPKEGHFCMVGDPQQSIYRSRANLSHYLKLHEYLGRGTGSGELKFSVTFRCDKNIIQWVNESAPSMLNGDSGQVSFVPLQERPRAGAGQVVRLEIQRGPELHLPGGKKSPVGLQEKMEAEQLVAWLKKSGLKNLRAGKWSEVAVLCPRKKWLRSISKELVRWKIPFQIHSTNDLRGDCPTYAWFASLVLIMAQPQNSYEIVGVLREIFGLSDQQLADFSGREGERFQIVSPSETTGPVEMVLKHLVEIRKKWLRLPLRDAAVELVQSTQLRQRLESIRLPSSASFSRQLDDLLIQAAIAEAEGLDGTEWAKRLKEGFFKNVEAVEIEEGSLQLITCQKAKGLQWDAVIVPFMFRKIRDRKPDYPRVASFPQNGIPSLLFHGAEVGEEENESLARAADQEMQRILYVAMTRAKRTLVLLDDSEIFPPPRREGKTRSFADHLFITQEFLRAKWKNLPSVLTPDESLKEGTVISSRSSLPSKKKKNIPQEARKNAEVHPKRILPHSLAKTIEDHEPETNLDLDPEWIKPREKNEGRFYGDWWHSWMQKFWGKELMEKTGNQTDPSGSPDPERAKREWGLFLKSDLWVKLSSPGLVIHPEMPFLWNRGPIECMEGLIDLAVFDPESHEWLIVDWKTDQIRRDQTGVLLERYSPQISAYGEALAALTGLPAKKILYSTPTGLEIPVV